jgi:GNAT superfamily N-acetyltransferase
VIVRHLSRGLIPPVIRLMDLGAPYVRTRTESDYWLYATLFSSTCPVAVIGDDLVGAVVAFRSQDNPDSVYVQDVITHPDHRGRGVARTLLGAVADRGAQWRCRRLYLTSEPDNTAAHATWLALGFANVRGDRDVGGVSVISDYKGPGKHRAVYELILGATRSGGLESMNP